MRTKTCLMFCMACEAASCFLVTKSQSFGKRKHSRMKPRLLKDRVEDLRRYRVRGRGRQQHSFESPIVISPLHDFPVHLHRHHGLIGKPFAFFRIAEITTAIAKWESGLSGSGGSRAHFPKPNEVSRGDRS